MAKYRICLIEGDGIGHEVIPATRRVLDAAGFDAEYVQAEAGYEYFLDHGTSVPQATYDWVAWPQVEEVLRGRHPDLHVVITGRDAIPELVALADTVSEINPVKHAYERGIGGQQGIEY